MTTLKRNHRSALALTALAVAVTSRALLLPAWAGPIRYWFGTDDNNHPELVRCVLNVKGKIFPCQSVGTGRDTGAGELVFIFVQARSGIPTDGLMFKTERQGVEISERRLVYSVTRVVTGSYPDDSSFRSLGDGRGRCILDVSEETYGIVVQSCTFTLTNGQTVSAEATYVNGIKGDFGPD